MTKPAHPAPSRPDHTDDALLLFVDALLDDFFIEPGNQDSYETLARGGRKTKVKAGQTVSIGSMKLSDHGEAGLAMRAGSPEITVSITHPRFSATVAALYNPSTAMMTEARTIGVKGNHKKLLECVDNWADAFLFPSTDDDAEEDIGDALAALLSGGGSPFDGESDPGEPPPPSPRDKTMVDTLARALSRELKRKNPDMRRHENEILALEQSPQSLWPILDGLIAACTASPRDEALIDAWRFLLEGQLSAIRYRIDNGWDWARRMAEDYQRKLIEIGREGRVAPDDFAAMVGALGEARIEVKAETRTSLADAGLASPDPKPPAELQALMRGLMDQMASSASSPFEVAAGLGEATRVMPSELRCFMVYAFALSSHAVLRDTVPLLLLVEEQEVRRAAAAALEQSAAPDTMSPDALRRMIAIRDWVPEADRPPIDQAIRKARQKGVECAQWPREQDLVITASTIDGSGAHSILLTSRGGRKGVMAGVLLKLGAGVADGWCDTGASRRDINETLATLHQSCTAGEVDREYLDTAIQHSIAVGASAGRPPNSATLQIAELAGGAGWRSRPLDIEAESRRLFDSLPAGQTSSAAVEASLERSGKWIDENFAESWFLDDAEVRDIVGRARSGGMGQAVDRLMAEAMPKRKAQWAERFLLLALRARAAKDRKQKGYANDFVTLAYSLCDDRAPRSVPLMVAILRRTVEIAQIARW